MLQAAAIAVSLAITAVAVTLFVRAIRRIVAVVRLGRPLNRTYEPKTRTVTMVRETLGHTRMLQWTRVGAAHWFIMVGFGLLFATLVNAYGQLFDPHFILPVIGHFPPFEWVTELFAWAMVLAIVPFMVYRATRPKDRARGVRGRFFGSTMWQGYFVEWVILFVGICILLLRFLEYAITPYGDEPQTQTALHFPLTAWAGAAFDGLSESSLAQLIWAVATVKIVVSMVWMITLGLNTTMGVAWHRFLAFFNVWFRREPDGRPALGALKPMMVDGKAFDLEMVDDIDEDTPLGVGKVEDFAWKGILDFSTCTECGRCQSQCPAWNTDKPLSPKMLVLDLRDHAHQKAPYLTASAEERPSLPELVRAEAERPLVGATEGPAWAPTGGAVIDDDVLWSCTTCGACVQQCPVDIEHVDHVVDMRRYQVLVESRFPSELNSLFRGLESKGNPWNMSPNARLDWAKGLDVEVKQVGVDVEDLSEVEWLFWVGCAGAYEDRAKKTTRAVAELLDLAGVSWAVLGDGETCTGDPARRAGNEFVFQQLAMENAEVLKESQAKKVVATCAHCFNTLKNEYSQFGLDLEVVHHTQLLNRLVREGRLTPVAAADGPRRSVTYHDPCYLGRHNKVYEPPRELLSVIPSAEFTEMERHGERSFCCGAGGARMWMEEGIGERINLNRTTEAVGTGADRIAVGCPYCRVMLSDGLTTLQAKGDAREEVEVLDVAQMLLESVKRGPTPDAEPNDDEADDAQYPLTVAHDGTEDPEAAPAVQEAAPPEASAASVGDRAQGPASAADPAPVAADSAGDGAPVPAAVDGSPALLVRDSDLVVEAYADYDVETILEGDEVEISEFKARLKAELKAEVLAELKEELADDSAEDDTDSSTRAGAATPAATADAPVTSPDAGQRAAASGTSSGGAAGGATAATSGGATAATSGASDADGKTEGAKEDDRDEGEPPPMLIGSL